MSSNSPYQSLKDIEKRKQQLRKQIARQENKLAQDFDAYQDDVDTVKRMWSSVMGIRNFGKRAGESKVGKLTKKAGEAAGLLGGGSKLSTAVTIAARVLVWAFNRKKKTS